MAAPIVLSVNAMSIPGLGMPLDKAQLNRAGNMYNVLPHITEQVELQTTIPDKISDLLRIIDRHAMGDNFRVHSLHRHTKLPANTIRLETDAGKTGYTWTNAKPIDRVDFGRFTRPSSSSTKAAGSPSSLPKGPCPSLSKPSPKTSSIKSLYIWWTTGSTICSPWSSASSPSIAPRRAWPQPRSRSSGAMAPSRPSPSACLSRISPMLAASSTTRNARCLRAGMFPPRGGDGGPRDSSPDKPDPGSHWNEATKPDGTKTHKVFFDSTEPVTPELVVRKLVDMGYLRG